MRINAWSRRFSSATIISPSSLVQGKKKFPFLQPVQGPSSFLLPASHQSERALSSILSSFLKTAAALAILYITRAGTERRDVAFRIDERFAEHNMYIVYIYIYIYLISLSCASFSLSLHFLPGPERRIITWGPPMSPRGSRARTSRRRKGRNFVPYQVPVPLLAWSRSGFLHDT